MNFNESESTKLLDKETAAQFDAAAERISQASQHRSSDAGTTADGIGRPLTRAFDYDSLGCGPLQTIRGGIPVVEALESAACALHATMQPMNALISGEDNANATDVWLWVATIERAYATLNACIEGLMKFEGDSRIEPA